MCYCTPQILVPVEENCAQPYWGYLHAEDLIWHVKYWYESVDSDVDCDLCHAKKEAILGNDAIKYICPFPVYALNNRDAAHYMNEFLHGRMRLGTWDDTDPNKKDQDLQRFVGIEDE